MEKLNLQYFAETNTTITTDIEPAISVDFTNRIAKSLAEFQEILGITNLIPMASGNTIKVYETSVDATVDQVAEGETIGLTKISRPVAQTIEIALNKYRKLVTAEAIQRSGYEIAVNTTDEKLVSMIQKDIKGDFFELLETGTATATGDDLQEACANAWAALEEAYEDEEVNAVFFANPVDVASYLGSATVSTQTAFGLSYLSDFLGLGTLIVSPKVTSGTVLATAKENLNGAYVPANGDIGSAFGLTTDETGLVGMTHTAKTETGSIETFALSGAVFFPERLDGIVVTTIGATA